MDFRHWLSVWNRRNQTSWCDALLIDLRKVSSRGAWVDTSCGSSQRTSWQNVLFTTLTRAQMAHVLAIRSERVSLFRIGLFSNKALLAAVSLTVLLQFALIYVPPPQTIFHTVSLSVFDLAITSVAAEVIFAAVETEKWASRRPGEASQSSQSAPGRRV